MSDESGEARRWLERFEARNGRPLRVLHMGNIANNAYNNAKIQRQWGIEADVACWDYYDIMGSPEWEDAEFEGDVGEPFFPDFWAVDLKGFVRPRWFVQGRVTVCQRYLLARAQGRRLTTRLLWWQLNAERWLLCRRSRPADCARMVVKALLAIRRWYRRNRAHVAARLRAITTYGRRVARRLIAPTRPRHALSHAAPVRPAPATRPTTATDATPLSAKPFLEQRFRQLFPHRTPLTYADYAPYLSVLPAWDAVMERYDIVHAYCLDPVPPCLAQRPNYVAYEHGTLREIPFEDTPRGRLAAISYRDAPAVCVTNTDVVGAAREIGIPDGRLIRLPHAIDSNRLLRFGTEHAHLRPQATPATFFSPSRQDWVDRDPSWTKGNDVAIRALEIVVAEGRECRLLLGGWGRDIDASRALIDELGLDDFVTWMPPLQKRKLWEGYIAHHAVVDQFGLPAIGGVTFEALAIGSRVITSVDQTAARDFFGEPPPLFAAATPETVAQAMRQIIDDPSDESGIGHSAREWFARFHSSERILALGVDAYQKVADGAIDV